MYTDTDGELDTFGFLQTYIQVFHRSENTQPRAYCSVSVIFMGLGIAKVHEESIPKELGDMSLIALDNFGTNSLIRTDHVPVLFGIELGGEFSGLDQITEHHGKLSALCLRRMGCY